MGSKLSFRDKSRGSYIFFDFFIKTIFQRIYSYTRNPLFFDNPRCYASAFGEIIE